MKISDVSLPSPERIREVLSQYKISISHPDNADKPADSHKEYKKSDDL